MILQPGQTRMDAALDHICKMGFSRPLVRKTVKDLLKVYGEDGWMLIEEDAYKVLLDYILDEQEAAQTNNLLKVRLERHLDVYFLQFSVIVSVSDV
ncbi:putative [histone H3]-lysine(4) N-trimethyltransferase [Helianthus annuus]|nr:putative [histone H3]-lysine(4) N-trimethyltransferase [Helianthus annuus]